MRCYDTVSDKSDKRNMSESFRLASYKNAVSMTTATISMTSVAPNLAASTSEGMRMVAVRTWCAHADPQDSTFCLETYFGIWKDRTYADSLM